MRALAALALLSGCALQTWALPQPTFHTDEVDTAFARAVEATKAHCGGARLVNEEASVVVGPWQAWDTGDGLVLTQCLVSLLRSEKHTREVRVTFAARSCPASELTDLEALLPSCERTDVVPQLVGKAIERQAAALEKDIAR